MGGGYTGWRGVGRFMSGHGKPKKKEEEREIGVEGNRLLSPRCLVLEHSLSPHPSFSEKRTQRKNKGPSPGSGTWNRRRPPPLIVLLRNGGSG